jgi:magnesium chelatase family protein
MVSQRSNPQPGGYFNDPSRERPCTPPLIQRYAAKISGPLLDRIDIRIDMPAVKYRELREEAGDDTSNAIRARVAKARERQIECYQGQKIHANAQTSTRQIRQYCGLTADCERLLENAVSRLGLSARAHDRMLKAAQTIADLDGAESIGNPHISEAIQYRSLDRNYWPELIGE